MGELYVPLCNWGNIRLANNGLPQCHRAEAGTRAVIPTIRYTIYNPLVNLRYREFFANGNRPIANVR